MKYLERILILLLVYATYSCNNSGEKLVFNDKPENIQNALLEMTALVYKLPKNSYNFNTYYYFANNTLEINRLSERSEDSTRLITEQALQHLHVNDRMRFFKLAKYLKNNGMQSGYIDQELNKCIFLYHSSENTSFNDVREILILKKLEADVLNNSYKILDSNDMLYLVAPIRPIDN